MKKTVLSSPIFAALSAAFLFGASTPFAKQLLVNTSPLLVAGLLYLGSGVGLILFRFLKNLSWKPSGLLKREWLYLFGAIIFGGMLGPILLMIGLTQMTASKASLFLNLEAVFTALLAWIFFREHTERRIILGMFLIVLGGAILAWPHSLSQDNWLSAFIVAGACLCWAIDNNLTRSIAAGDALFIASSKGLVAGSVNIILGFILGLHFPEWTKMSYALIIGFLGYGLSLLLFILALRGLGTARTGAYFSTAPFIGAAIAILFFNEQASWTFWIATILMGLGVWLHLTEKHKHLHSHEEIHNHSHTHDEHHQHEHDFVWNGKEPHRHIHQHKQVTHSHPHYPDTHHRHEHK